MDKIFLGDTYRTNGTNLFEIRHYIIYAESKDEAIKKLVEYGDLASVSKVSDGVVELNLSKIDEHKLLENNSNAYLIRGYSTSSQTKVDIMVFAESAAEARRSVAGKKEIRNVKLHIMPKIHDIIL